MNFNDMDPLERLNFAMQDMAKLRSKNILQDATVTYNPETFDAKEVDTTIQQITDSVDGLLRSNISFLASIKNYFIPAGFGDVNMADFTVFNRDGNKVVYQFKKASDYLDNVLDILNKNRGMVTEIDFSGFKKIYEKHKKVIDEFNALLIKIRYNILNNTSIVRGPRAGDVNNIVKEIYNTVVKINVTLRDIQDMSPYGKVGKGMKYFEY